MDPEVEPVEKMLDAAAARSSIEPGRWQGRLVISYAVWLCAYSEKDAPTWLIYATDDGGVGWERVPEGPGSPDISDIVEAAHLTGGHFSPEDVLAWVRGEQSRPWRGAWPGDFPEDGYIYEEIQRRILGRPCKG